MRTWTARFRMVVPSVDRMLIGDEQVALPWNCQAPATTGAEPTMSAAVGFAGIVAPR